MRIEALQPFGREILDASAASMSDAELNLVRSEAALNAVVVLRGQDIDDRVFVAFLRRLGPLTFTRGETPVRGCPELNVVSNVDRTRPPRSVFHTDTSYVSRPPSFTALRAVTLPSQGGETLLVSQYHACATLPAALRERLRSVTARHRVTGLTLAQSDQSSCVHPVLRRHPVSGKVSLYLSTPERCDSLSGFSARDSDQMIQRLYAHSTREEAIYRHRWLPGDLLLWDNRCTMHRADHSRVLGHRVMHRGMCAGEAPIAA